MSDSEKSPVGQFVVSAGAFRYGLESAALFAAQGRDRQVVPILAGVSARSRAERGA